MRKGKRSLWSLFFHKGKDLVLVVGDIPPFPNGGFTFVEPTGYGLTEKSCDDTSKGKTWQETAQDVMKMLEGFRQEPAPHLQRISPMQREGFFNPSYSFTSN